MSGKGFIWLGVFIGSTIGGWLGSLLGGGNWLAWQGLVGSTLGAFLGIYVGYKLNQYF